MLEELLTTSPIYPALPSQLTFQVRSASLLLKPRCIVTRREKTVTPIFLMSIAARREISITLNFM